MSSLVAMLPGGSAIQATLTEAGEIASNQIKAFVPAYLAKLGALFLKSVMDNTAAAGSSLVDGSADDPSKTPVSARVIGQSGEGEDAHYDLLVVLLKSAGSEFLTATATYEDFEHLASAIKKPLAAAKPKGAPVLPKEKAVHGENGTELLSAYLEAVCDLVPAEPHLREFLGFPVEESLNARQRRINEAAFLKAYTACCATGGFAPLSKYKTQEIALTHLILTLVRQQVGAKLEEQIELLPAFKTKAKAKIDVVLKVSVSKTVSAAWGPARKTAAALIGKIDGLIAEKGDELRGSFTKLRESILNAISSVLQPAIAKMQTSLARVVDPVSARVQAAITPLKAIPLEVAHNLKTKYVDVDTLSEDDLKALVDTITGPAKTIGSILTPVSTVLDELATELAELLPWLGAVSTSLKALVALVEGQSAVVARTIQDYSKERVAIEAKPTTDENVPMRTINLHSALEVGVLVKNAEKAVGEQLSAIPGMPASAIGQIQRLFDVWGLAQLDAVEKFRQDFLTAKPADKAAIRAQFKISAAVAAVQARRELVTLNWQAAKAFIMDAAITPVRETMQSQLGELTAPLTEMIPAILTDQGFDLLDFALDVVFMAISAAVEQILDAAKVSIFGADAEEDTGAGAITSPTSSSSSSASSPAYSVSSSSTTHTPVVVASSSASPEASPQAAEPATQLD
jgi:hypothetical protein